MNTRLAPRLIALASAAFFTVVILSGIDALASVDGGDRGGVVAQTAPAASAPRV